jgi:hypothetical protein
MARHGRATVSGARLCVYVYVCIHIHMHMYNYMCMYMYQVPSLYIYIMCVYVHMLSVCVYIHIWTRTDACVYMYIYTCTYIWTCSFSKRCHWVPPRHPSSWLILYDLWYYYYSTSLLLLLNYFNACSFWKRCPWDTSSTLEILGGTRSTIGRWSNYKNQKPIFVIFFIRSLVTRSTIGSMCSHWALLYAKNKNKIRK